MEAKFTNEAIEVRGSIVIYETVDYKHDKWTFLKGSYGGREVLIVKELNYINVSKLCSSYKPNKKSPVKKYSQWSSNDSGQALLDACNSRARILARGATVDIFDVSIDLRGTYACKEIVLDVAGWLSVDFKMEMYEILDDIFDERARELERKLAKSKKVLLKKDKAINRLESLIHEQNTQISTLLELAKSSKEDTLVTHKRLNDTTSKLDITHDMLEDVTDKLEETKHDNKVIQSELTLVNKKLGVVLPQRVVLEEDSSKHNTFLLIRIKKDFQYYWTRTQKGRVKSVLAKQGFELEDIVLRIGPTPNAINLSNKCKEKIPYITTSGNYVYIRSKTEAEFIQDIKDVDADRYQVIVPSRLDVLNTHSLRRLNQACMRHQVPLYSGKQKAQLVEHILNYETREGKTII